MAYVPGDPQRVRLVDGWAPAYVSWLEFGVFGLVAAPIVALRRGLGSSARDRGRRSGWGSRGKQE